MRLIFVAVLSLLSFSAFALDECTVDLSFNAESNKIQAELTKQSEYIAYLTELKPCEDLYLELTSKAALTADIEGTEISIQYIFPQDEHGKLSNQYLETVRGHAVDRNAKVLTEDNNIIFERN